MTEEEHIDMFRTLSQVPSDINEALYSGFPTLTDDGLQMQSMQQIERLQGINNRELSVDEIHRILDLPSVTLVEMANSPGQEYHHNRTTSISSNPWSPESGISGCQVSDQENRSPMMNDVQSPLGLDVGSPQILQAGESYQVHEPVMVQQYDMQGPNNEESFLPFSIPTLVSNGDGTGYFDSVDIASLLELAKESEELMESTELEILPQAYVSPLKTKNNPLLTQTYQNQGFIRQRSNESVIHSPPRRTIQPTQEPQLLNQEDSWTVISSTEGAITNQAPKQHPTPSVIVQHNSSIKEKPMYRTTVPQQEDIHTYAFKAKTKDDNETRHSIPGAMIFTKPSSSSVAITFPKTAVSKTQIMTDEEIVRIEKAIPKSEPVDYLCYVCGEKAGKHSYYGGQVCASCRAFFRRSVQSKYYEIFQCKKEKQCKVNSETRKNCQFCRFKKCIEAGMKTSWVLSDDERNRRFNKFNKINLKSVDKENTALTKNLTMRLPELYMAFTGEESKVLQDVHTKFGICQRTWVKNLFLLDRRAGINFVEAAFKITPFQFKTWKVVEKAWQLYFVKNVIPHFTQGTNLTGNDVAHISNGHNSGISHFFRSSRCLKLSVPEIKKEPKDQDEGPCPLRNQVDQVTSNKDIVDSLDLSEMMSKLNLVKEGRSPSFPTYKDVFPAQWANNRGVEERHREILAKIQNWPLNQENEFDTNLSVLMTLIILFNSEYNSLVNKKSVEQIQMKYILLLQRYLRSRMPSEMANKKFLEAMLLLSYTREIWEMNNNRPD